MKRGEEVEADIFKIAEDGKKELQKKQQQLIEAVAAVEAVKKEAEDAKTAGDLAAYKTAMDKMLSVEFERDVIRNRVRELNGPLVSKEQYDTMAADIFSKYSKQARDYIKQVHDLIEQCVDICGKYKAMIAAADHTLETLQTGVYKNADIPVKRDDRGNLFFPNESDYLRFRDKRVLCFVEDVVNMMYYRYLLEDANPRTGQYIHLENISRHELRRYV